MNACLEIERSKGSKKINRNTSLQNDLSARDLIINNYLNSQCQLDLEKGAPFHITKTTATLQIAKSVKVTTDDRCTFTTDRTLSCYCIPKGSTFHFQLYQPNTPLHNKVYLQEVKKIRPAKTRHVENGVFF